MDIRVLRCLFIFWWFAVTGCQHTVTTLSSTPSGAEVYALTEKGERGQILGKTPLTLSKDAAGFEIAKPGYAPSLILLPEFDSPRLSNMTVTLIPQSRQWFLTNLLSTQADVLNESVSELLELQVLITSRKTNDANNLIKKIEVKYDQVALFHLLSGHHNYLKKDTRKAKAEYARVVELDPRNSEARQMLDLLMRQGVPSLPEKSIVPETGGATP